MVVLDAPSSPSCGRQLLLIGAFMFSWSSMKITLPALPTMASIFGMTDSMTRVIEGPLFFLCFAGSHVPWGLLADRKGRRFVLLIGPSICLAGSTMILAGSVAHRLPVYIVGRCLEGLGAGCVSPAIRAFMFDTMPGAVAPKVLAKISACAAAVPALTPLFMGSVFSRLGLSYIFVIYGVANLLLLIAFYFMLPVRSNAPPPIEGESVLKSITAVLGFPIFWAYGLNYMCLSGTLLGYYAANSFWYQQEFGWKVDEYAFLSAPQVACYVIALILSRMMLNVLRLESIMVIASAMAVLPSAVVLLIALFAQSLVNYVQPFVICFSVFAAGAGMSFPVSNAGATALYPQSRGLVSAILVSCTFGGSGIMSFILGELRVRKQCFQLGVAMLIGSGIPFLTSSYLRFVYVPKQERELSMPAPCVIPPSDPPSLDGKPQVRAYSVIGHSEDPEEDHDDHVTIDNAMERGDTPVCSGRRRSNSRS